MRFATPFRCFRRLPPLFACFQTVGFQAFGHQVSIIASDTNRIRIDLIEELYEDTSRAETDFTLAIALLAD